MSQSKLFFFFFVHWPRGHDLKRSPLTHTESPSASHFSTHTLSHTHTTPTKAYTHTTAHTNTHTHTHTHTNTVSASNFCCIHKQLLDKADSLTYSSPRYHSVHAGEREVAP